MLVDRLLDHLRIDIEAAGEDHVLLAVEDEEIAVVIHDADVAGEKTAIRKSCGGFLRPVPVALHHVLALDPQLADLAGAEHAMRIIERHHLDRDARERKPDGSRPCEPAQRRAGAGWRGLVMPQPLGSGRPERRPNRSASSTGNGAPPEAQLRSAERSRCSMPGWLISAAHIVGTPGNAVTRLTSMSRSTASTSKRGRSRSSLPLARWRNITLTRP